MKITALLTFVCLTFASLTMSRADEPTTRLSGPIPTDAGNYRLRYLLTVQNKPVDMCVVFSNSKKVAQTPGKVGALIFLCGVSERGTNGDQMFTNGPAAEMHRFPQLNDSIPVMIVSPQCPPDRGWAGPGMPESILSLVDLLIANPKIDPDRIYLTGISMGGAGLYVTAAAGPKYFAAVSPISPAIIAPEKVVPTIKDLPMWLVCGEKNDRMTTAARAMAAALQAAGSSAIYTELPGAGHQCWPQIYTKPEFYDWLMAHVRGQAPTKQFTADELMKIATRPIDDPITDAIVKDFATFSPFWQIVNCGRDGKPGLRADFNGHKNVFAATTVGTDIPCVMQTAVRVPADKHAKINITAGCDNDSPWRLVIEGNGIVLLDQKIDQTTTKDGWIDLSVDLATWTGKGGRINALLYQAGDKPGPAYLAKLSVDQE